MDTLENPEIDLVRNPEHLARNPEHLARNPEVEVARMRELVSQSRNSQVDAEVDMPGIRGQAANPENQAGSPELELEGGKNIDLFAVPHTRMRDLVSWPLSEAASATDVQVC